MPVLRVEDPDTGQVVDVPWEGEGVPDAETIRAAREKALATAPKPAAVRLIDMFRSVGAEAESFRQQHPAFGGELWAAKKTAEFAGQQLAKLRRPIDRGIGYTLKAAAERSQAALADPAKRAALEARYPGEASAQEAANQRRLAAAARMIADQGTLGSEFRAATSGPGGPATKSQAVSDVALGMGVDFVSDPSNLAIGGLSKLGRLGAQLQYVLGAALTGTAGLGAAQKAKEVAVLASEGKLNSPTAAAAATEGLLSALMAGFGARGVMKGWSRDQVLGEIERAQKEADMLAAEGVQATPPEVAGAVGFLKPLLLRHEKLRTEFNKNVKGMHKRQIDALRKAMADLEANPTDEQAAKVYESLKGQAEAPVLEGEKAVPDAEAPPSPVSSGQPPKPGPPADPAYTAVSSLFGKMRELRGKGVPDFEGFENTGRPDHLGQTRVGAGVRGSRLNIDEALKQATEEVDFIGRTGKAREVEIADRAARKVVDAAIHEASHGPEGGHNARQAAREADMRQALGASYDQAVAEMAKAVGLRGVGSQAAPPASAPKPAAPPPAASATGPASEPPVVSLTRPPLGASTGPSLGASTKRKAILFPAREADGRITWSWGSPSGRELSGSFPSREAALAQRPEGYNYLDDGYQPLPEDVQAVRPPAKAPLLKQVRMSGDRSVLFRFTGDEPIDLLQFRALTHKYGGTVEALGNDAFLDTPDTQKFRIGFPTPDAARKALADFESATTPLEAAPPALPPAPPTQPPAASPSAPSGGNRHPIPDSAVASLRSWIGQHAQRDPLTALHAQEGLDRLLGLGDQRIPLQGSERSALRKVFGKDAYNIFREYDASVAAKRTPLQKGRDLVLDLLFNSSRSVESSEVGPSSATLRQGGPVAIYQTLTHPIKTARDVLDSARSFFNPQIYRGIQKDMANSSYIYRPAAPGKPPVKVDLTRLMDEFGVERATKEMGPDQANEALNDYFSQGDVIQKVPVVGEVVKGANRAYAAILDPYRRETLRAMDELMRDAGMTPETHPSDWQLASDATNQLTGLAKLPKIPLPGGKSLDLNAGSGNLLVRMLYYAPRFFYSRLFNLADLATAGVRFQNSKSLHDFFTKLEPVHPVRKQYLKIMGSYAAFWGTILYAASHLPGVEVEIDLRSSDVVKGKVGDTRFDVWSGLQQPLRFFAQMASGQRKSTESGKVSPIVGSPGNYVRRLATELSTGEAAPPDKTGPFTSDAEDVVGTFLESKESPAVSYFRDIQRGGKDVFGREADLNPLTRFLPFGMRDVSEVAKSNPALVPAVAAAASLGIGTQTYQPRKPAGVGEAETKVKALRATQDEPKPEPAPEEKLAKRVKKGARAEYELKIREAMARGDDLAALEAIEEADFAGFRFRELEKKILGYDTLEDEEDDESEE